jgi:hypothetical protein
VGAGVGWQLCETKRPMAGQCSMVKPSDTAFVLTRSCMLGCCCTAMWFGPTATNQLTAARHAYHAAHTTVLSHHRYDMCHPHAHALLVCCC